MGGVDVVVCRVGIHATEEARSEDDPGQTQSEY